MAAFIARKNGMLCDPAFRNLLFLKIFECNKLLDALLATKISLKERSSMLDLLGRLFHELLCGIQLRYLEARTWP